MSELLTKIRRVRAANQELVDLHVMVIDDNSPDGTSDVVKQMMTEDQSIQLMKRDRRYGFAQAYIAGFKHMLENGYDIAITMDADLSHDPQVIPSLLLHILEADLVIGSRYVPEGGIINWPLYRLCLSKFANIYASAITQMNIRDCTAGFQCLTRSLVEKIDWSSIHTEGYAFLIELKHLAIRLGARVKEIPIVFVDRKMGSSKISKGVVFEAVWMVWKLFFAKLKQRKR